MRPAASPAPKKNKHIGKRKGLHMKKDIKKKTPATSTTQKATAKRLVGFSVGTASEKAKKQMAKKQMEAQKFKEEVAKNALKIAALLE